MERTMAVTRRQFMKVSAAGLAASSVGALGFMEAGDALAAGVRPFKLDRGTLCARGAASLGYVHSVNRLKYPMHRKAGSDKFERVSWDFAMDRIVKLMKDDRDKNFITKNRDGVTVNRWLSTGVFGGSSLSNEAGYLTYKFVRATGILAFEDQARI